MTGNQKLIKAVLNKIDLRFSILEISVKIASIEEKQIYSDGVYNVKVRKKIEYQNNSIDQII